MRHTGLTLLRFAALTALISTTALAHTDGVGYDSSKDELRLDNYVLDGNLKFNLGLFELKQNTTTMAGVSPGFGYRLLGGSRSWARLYVDSHANFGALSDGKDFGAAGYYDAGLLPELVLFHHLTTHVYAGYRKDNESYYISRGTIHNSGIIVRYGLSLEF